jgi:glutamine amidotransferase
MGQNIVVVDYGMGNICSVVSAIEHLGVQATVSNEPRTVSAADGLILPGVGSFGKAIVTLRSSGLAETLIETVVDKKCKILGICLGMQLFAQEGTEDGKNKGLGLLPTTVNRYTRQELADLKVPHIGYNEVVTTPNSILFKGITSPAFFYFVHSYRVLPDNLPGLCALSHYGVEFLAAYEYENIFATQFHPEKSQSNGLKLLNNFLKI